MLSKQTIYKIGRRARSIGTTILYYAILCANMAEVHSKTISCYTATLEKQSKERIEQLYQQVQQQQLSTMPARVQFFSEQFLGKPYALTALGEGRTGKFDQAPLYRVDAFDCQTFVETILALARSYSFQDFINCLRHIRYAGGKIAYTKRYHFISPDWNRANSQQGIIQDVTPSISNQRHQSIARLAQTTIDVANWYRHKDLQTIRLCQASSRVSLHALQLLQKFGNYPATESAEIAYLPLSRLFDNQGHPNQQIIEQIPNGAIIEIVRPNWDLTKTIGTHLNVSHLGFAIREGKQLYFYQASASEGAVIKSSLTAYLASIAASPTIKGINIQRILPRSA